METQIRLSRYNKFISAGNIIILLYIYTHTHTYILLNFISYLSIDLSIYLSIYLSIKYLI